MLRTITIRLKPTRNQSIQLDALLVHLCELYNAALQERRDAWKTCRKNISYYDQQGELTQLRTIDLESASFPSAIQRDPLRRVDRAFKAFFSRLKLGQTAGYPRFKSSVRYDSFTVDAQNFRLTDRILSIVKLGSLKFKTRCKLRGTPKELRVRRVGKSWVAAVCFDIGEVPVTTHVVSSVGVDVGLTSLATLSDATVIPNPRWTKRMEDKLAKANQSLARKKRGSKNRAKARERLRRVHQRITGLRRTYLHQVSRSLVETYDLIAFEDLKIKNMTRSTLAKHIMDAAWGELIRQIIYKAEEAGKWAVAVNPRNTTQVCSRCGRYVKKELYIRRHDCTHCGLSICRDLNASINILALGESVVATLQNGSKPTADSASAHTT